MFLLFDIGNTRLKWALSNSSNIISTGAIDLTDLNETVLDQQFASFDQPSSIFLSNVATKSICNMVIKWLNDRFQTDVSIVKVTKNACDIKNMYSDPSSLGVDRWVAAIGARHLVAQGDLIIIDVGTAVTIDWLSNQNTFEGGVILPGLALMHDSLVEQTAGIKSEYSDLTQIIGKTTKECVSSGIGFGLAGAIERIVDEMNKNINRPTTVILTGGGSKSLAAIMKFDSFNEPNLVLLGLLKLAI